MECIFQGKGLFVVSLDARSKSGMKSITDIVMEACKEKIERDRKRGIKNRPVRAMCGGDSKRRKVHIYQFIRRKSLCQDRKQAGRDKGQAVDQAQ